MKKQLANILEMCQSISQAIDEDKIRENLSSQKDQIKKEIQYLEKNKERASELLNILLPENIMVNNEFYETLSKIPPCLEFEKPSDQLIGILWSKAYQQIPPHSRGPFLDLWINKEVFRFWDYVEALPTFLSNTEISPVFAPGWFLRIGNAVSGDLAGGGFFRGIENYAFNFPFSGLAVFEYYIKEELDEMKLHIAAILLGTLRAKSKEDQSFSKTVDKWDVDLQKSPKIESRICYYRSWGISFVRSGIPIDKLRSVLNLALGGTIEEQEEAFDVVRRCSTGQIEEEFSCFVVRWLNRYVSPKLSPRSKLSVVNTVSQLRDYHRRERPLIDTVDSNKIIIAIQPIEKEYTGIWREIEHYLVRRLHENMDLFGNLLKQISDTNPNILVELFTNRELNYLNSEMNRVGVSQLIIDFIFSKNDNVRRLGNVLFSQIKVEKLPEKEMKRTSNTELRLALWEFIRKPLHDGETTAHFLLMLEPLFQNTSDGELLDTFEQEMILQAINYPGACLEKWKTVEKPSDLLNRVIEKADEYFEKLKKAHNSPINSFQFPDFLEAEKKGYRNLSHQISKGVYDQSLLLQLVTKVNLIYGDHWSTLDKGDQLGLGDPSPLNELSHQIEMPRLEMITPGTMALRRIEALHNIRFLQSKETEHAG